MATLRSWCSETIDPDEGRHGGGVAGGGSIAMYIHQLPQKKLSPKGLLSKFGFIMKTNTFITLSTATANIGVLVGLIFLLVELKQTRKIALSEIRQERTMSVIDEYASFASDKAFSDILHTRRSMTVNLGLSPSRIGIR